MDQFEKYLKENRSNLDTEQLDQEQMLRLQFAINRAKSKRRVIRLSAAAAIAASLIIGVVLINGKTDPVAPTNTVEALFTDHEPDLVAEEEGYIHEISTMVNSIREQSVPADYAHLFQDFTTQLDILDKQYELYRTELDKNGTTKELTQQIIYNYQLKITVLQKLQSEISKINTLIKNEKNDFKKIQLNI